MYAITFQQTLICYNNQFYLMIEDPESKSSTGGITRKIPNFFVCGEVNCKKSYGTNAALYTHIKKKHHGIEPQGTSRPKINTKKEESDEEEKMKNEVVLCRKCNRKECKCKYGFSNELIDLYKDFTFILFIRYMGLFGEIEDREGGIWCRVTMETLNDLSRNDIDQMVENVKEQYKLEIELSERQYRYLLASSKLWAQSHLAQLYNGLIACVAVPNKNELVQMFEGKAEMRMFVECMNKNENSFNVLVKLFLTGDDKQT